MIASENFGLRSSAGGRGLDLHHKYAEGYPGRRYYGGCEYADVVENLARDRAKQLFGAAHANVQPHSVRRRMRRLMLLFCRLGTRSWASILRMAAI